MKNILTSLYLFVLVASPVFSQRDATINPNFSQNIDPSHYSNSVSSENDDGFWNNVIIKFNPTLIATGILQDGEYGAIIQFPLKSPSGQNSIFENMDAYIGGGYNRSFDFYTAVAEPNATGYTIRGGVYYHMHKKNMYRSSFFIASGISRLFMIWTLL